MNPENCPGCAKVRRKAAQGERYGCALHPSTIAVDAYPLPPPVLRPCTPSDPCDEHAAFGGAPSPYKPEHHPLCFKDGCVGVDNGCPIAAYEHAASEYARGRREAIEEAARYLRLHDHVHAANIVKRHEAEITRRP